MKITDVSSSVSCSEASRYEEIEREERTKRTLLQRYEIPIEHLDFSYVEKCTNVREVERILRILRSGEEGIYPELQKFVEKRLIELNPNSRVLRVETPALRTQQLEQSERDEIVKGLDDWAQLANSVKAPSSNNIFSGSGDGIDDVESMLKNFPLPVRGSKEQSMAEANLRRDGGSVVNKKKNENRIKSWEYDKWDKYNVDVELTKLDVVDMKTAEWEKREKPKLIEEQKRIEQLMKSEDLVDNPKPKNPSNGQEAKSASCSQSVPAENKVKEVASNGQETKSASSGLPIPAEKKVKEVKEVAASSSKASKKVTNKSYYGPTETPSYIEEVNEDDEEGEKVNTKPLFSGTNHGRKATVVIEDLNLRM